MTQMTIIGEELLEQEELHQATLLQNPYINMENMYYTAFNEK